MKAKKGKGAGKRKAARKPLNAMKRKALERRRLARLKAEAEALALATQSAPNAVTVGSPTGARRRAAVDDRAHFVQGGSPGLKRR